MAKATWLNVNPTKGSGNATVNVSSTAEHTGRNPRTTTLTWKASGVQDVVRNVSQAGKPEYVNMDSSAAASKEGKRVSISGVSNSSSLSFSLGEGNLNITLPMTYTAGSMPTTNGTPISGDPGAAQEYVFVIVIDVPANLSTSEKTRQVVVTDDAGNTAICRLTSAAGDAYVTVQSGTIELDYLGTPVAWTVSSNTSWTIE